MLTALPDGHLALAVSGGSDSMAMLHLVLQKRPPHAVTVLTVDHGLREGSRAEAERVARYCASHGAEHHTLFWLGEKPQTGIQAKARQARYDLMTRWCSAHGIGVLLTAHTMDDQAETVAMRRLRTTSPKSLAGIWPESTWNGVRVIRPLLHARREELRSVLRSAGVAWSEDPSNDNPKFERVRVRASLADDDVKTLAAEADVARAETEYCLAAAGDWLKLHATVEPTGLLRLPRHLFTAFAGREAFGVQREVLNRAIHVAGGGTPDPKTVEQTLSRVLVGHSFRTTLGGAMIAARRREILLGREPARIDSAPLAARGTPVLWDGRFEIVAPAGSAIAPAGPRCPKADKTLPAFVLAGLPMVTLPDGVMVLPHFQRQFGISVSLGEQFRL